MISELEPSIYRSPTSNGEDATMDLKMRIKYFEEMNKGTKHLLDTTAEKERNGYVRSMITDIEDGNPRARRTEVIVEKNYPSKEASIKRYESAVEEEIVSTDADSISSFDFTEFELKLNEKIREMEDTPENQEEPVAEEMGAEHPIVEEAPVGVSKEEPVESCTPIVEMETKSRETGPAVKKMVSFFGNPKAATEAAEPAALPRSAEIISDFENFKMRPNLLRCGRIATECEVVTKNVSTLVNGEELLLFSRRHQQEAAVPFRAPGEILREKPAVFVSNQILAEDGILTYFRVVCGEIQWHVLKRCTGDLSKFASRATSQERDGGSPSDSKLDLEDRQLSSFISTDVVGSVFLRTSFLIYDSLIVTVKILGKALCICSGNACLRVVRVDKSLSPVDDRSFSVSGAVFDCSCCAERDEWVKVLSQLL